MVKEQTKSSAGRVGANKLTLSSGELAKQAGGSVLVQYGETVVLGTATMDRPLSSDRDWLPLLVDYEEKFYAAGKIKGSRFVKREGRPHDEAIITSRLIDRAIRPLFPDGMINDVQVVVTVFSYDGENDPDIPAMIAAFGALMVSDIPWQGKLGAARVGRVGEEFVVNPTAAQRAESTLDLVLAGDGTNVAMLEGSAKEVPEAVLLDAIDEGQKAIQQVVGLLGQLQKASGKDKSEPALMLTDTGLIQRWQELARPTLTEKLAKTSSKEEIAQAERDAVAAVKSSLSEAEQETIPHQQIAGAVHELHGLIARENILDKDRRSDGRALDEIRPLHIRVGVLPRTHGSGLFQRGHTQILTTLTLGGPSDVLFLDTMEVEEKKRYLHYYNFPAFSVGEIRPNRGPGRREIGHGALAERALLPVLPGKEAWPYTMMLVSEVLESHGSSSMASVCGSSLALMDAGVPIAKPVAGIAMGLITDEDGRYKIMTDIAGIEDEKGDMDFKVAGTKDGVTAVQMDIKVAGLTRQILSDGLEQAKRSRLKILDAMNEVIAEPRADLSPYAPRIHSMRVPVDKIGDLIGPKGKHINEIIEQTGVEIDIDDDGLVSITTNDAQAMERAIEWVKNMTREIKPGERFEGKVTRIMDFGAFVELMPGVEGMVHISQFRDARIEKIDEVVKVGDIIPVIVIEIDQMGRINLSHKAAIRPGGPTARDFAERKRSGNGDRHKSRDHSGPFRGPRPPR